MKEKAFLLVAFLLALSAPVRADEVQEKVEWSRELVKVFMSQLRTELQDAMKAGGAANAIEVCSKKAPAIAQSLSQEGAWSIGRTSLKVRNPNNAPDGWERDGLDGFEQGKAGGRDPQSLESYGVVEQEGKRVFRYMQAIPTAPLCVTCHGKALPSAVREKLDLLYPQDQARGFAVGDLRGAFTIKRVLGASE